MSLKKRILVRSAVLISILFALVSLAGLREYASVPRGTAGSIRWGGEISAFLGFAYLFVYPGFVVLAPSLLIAAGLLWLWERLFERSSLETNLASAALTFVKGD